MWKVRLLVFLITVSFVIGVGWIVSLYARGFRFDIKTFSFVPKGLLVITSNPDGAQVFINGQLESATNTSLSLLPGSYHVEIKKEGYLTWKKDLVIKKEEVTKVDVYLFPQVPSLSSLTFTGALKPALSPDGTKIAYGVPAQETDEKVGIWIIDLVDLPPGFSREPRRITDIDPQNTVWYWSPDSRELLVVTKEGRFRLPTNTFTASTNLKKLTESEINLLIAAWKENKEKKTKDALGRLPKLMQELLSKSHFAFSPDEKKVIYIPSKDTNIPEKLLPDLPGSSTQKQERSIKAGQTYIYDIKEDRNFAVYGAEAELANEIKIPDLLDLLKKMEKNSKPFIYWFPTSSHIVVAEEGKVTIMDYDGTNRQVVFAGPYEAPYAIPSPNPSRLLILTNLGAPENIPTNLYSLSLK